MTNLDEPGKVDFSTNSPEVGTPITATLTDEDGPVTNVTWQWRISGATNISGAMSSSYTPVAADVGKILIATAMYNDPAGSNKKTAIGTVSSAVLAAFPQISAPTIQPWSTDGSPSTMTQDTKSR